MPLFKQKFNQFPQLLSWTLQCFNLISQNLILDTSLQNELLQIFYCYHHYYYHYYYVVIVFKNGALREYGT